MLSLTGHMLNWIALVSALLLIVPLVLFAVRSSKLLSFSTRISSACSAIVGAVFDVIKWAALLLALIQLAIVVMRYVFGINFIWLQEFVIWLFALLFLLAAAQALLSGEHVRVDIFYRDASPRRKALVDLAGTYLFLFPVCILIVWAAGPYVYRAWDVMEGSRETSGLPGVFLLKSAIPAFALLVACAGYTMAHRAVLVLTGREQA